MPSPRTGPADSGFGLFGIGGIGVGLDGAKLVQGVRLVPVCLPLPGEVERLACVLPASAGATPRGAVTC